MSDVFSVSVEGHWRLRATDVWPDGNAPENPTAEDVKAEMEKCGSMSRLIQEWNMTPDEAWVDGLRADLR